MDDQKMKIKIVVRPEDAHGAGHGADEAAEEARRARIRRSRFGLIALSALVVLGAIVAFVFMGNEPDAPDLANRDAPPAAADAAASSTRDSPTGGDKKGTAAPALADSRGAAGDGALDGETAADGAEAEASAPAGRSAADSAASDTSPGGSAAAPSAAASSPTSSQPAGTAPINGETLPSDTARAAGAADANTTSPAGDGRSASGVDSAVSSPAPGRAPPQGREAGQTSGQASGQGPSVATVPTKPNAGVARAQLTSRVAGREPVDVMRSPVDVGPRGRTVYYFTEFRNLSGQSVSHRWEYDGQVVATVPFKIGGNRWRVYSSKQIDASQSGPWRVSTVDRNDAVLSTSAFVAE